MTIPEGRRVEFSADVDSAQFVTTDTFRNVPDGCSLGLEGLPDRLPVPAEADLVKLKRPPPHSK